MRKPPEKGLYVSANDPSFRIVVEEVGVVEGEDEEDLNGYFLVTMVDEEDAGDMGAIGEELDPNQWFDLVAEYELKHVP